MNGTGVGLVERGTPKPEEQPKKKKRSEVKPESRADSVTADENQNSEPAPEDPPNKESMTTVPEDEIKVPK